MPSKEYRRSIELCQAHHRGAKCNAGQFMLRYRHILSEIIERLDVKSILDFGCGKGRQYAWKNSNGKTIEEIWGIKVAKYDPGLPEYEVEPPGTFDLVICTHVLGLVPVKDLDWVIPHLFSKANKAVFIALITARATKYKKAKYRVKSIPPTSWGLEEWMALFRKHKPPHLEVTFSIRHPISKGTYVLPCE